MDARKIKKPISRTVKSVRADRLDTLLIVLSLLLHLLYHIDIRARAALPCLLK